MKPFTKFPTKIKGFSLLEMMLYVSISSVILLSLSLLLTSLLSSRLKSQSIADVDQQGMQVLQLVTQTVRNAKSVDFPSVGATSTSLSVSVSDPMLSPTVFDVVNGVVRITEGSNPPIALTNSHVTVSSFVFYNISSTSSADRIVRTSFTVDYKNISGRNETSYTKSFIGSATQRQ